MTNAAPADHASETSSRRALLGAGVIGAVLAVAGSRVAGAAAPAPTGDDAIAEMAIGYELAARDLYDVAIAAGAGDELWQVMREQHESYAQRLSGIVGAKADTPAAAVVEQWSGDFGTDDPSGAGMELENALAATHVDWLTAITDVDIAAAVASIVASESRHAAVLGLRAGVTDGDALFVNAGAPIAEGA